MTRGSPKANIVGGILLLLFDGFRVLYGRLPLKGQFDTIDLAENSGLFWAYAASLAAVGAAAILWGVWGLRSQRQRIGRFVRARAPGKLEKDRPLLKVNRDL